MLKGLIPMLFKQVGKLPVEAKREYAALLADACDSFIEGDRAGFDTALNSAGFDDVLKDALSNALWTENQT